ncbi:unnamed protein product, partial [Brassica oleracea var. botrytis]
CGWLRNQERTQPTKLFWRRAQALCYHHGDWSETFSHGSFGEFGQQGTSISSRTEFRRLWRFLLRPYEVKKNDTKLKRPSHSLDPH